MKYKFILIIGLAVGISCESTKKTEEVRVVQEENIDVPKFNGDSAYFFVEKQLSFGYRIPGTNAHFQTGDFLVKSLESRGAEVTEQKFEAETWDGQKVPLRNIIGSFFPEKTKRILLAAHWDSRPFADKDPISPEMPMAGANDGASGVAVLLEIARNLALSAPENVGIDIIFFDGEDWGEAISTGYIEPAPGYESWWCLGSQYWSKNKHKPNYSAYYGILLDMVGAKNSKFYVEGLSQRFAPKVVDRIWGMANKLGYGSIFINSKQGEITDDHYFVNNIARIPMVDIVHYDPVYGYFGDYHHTLKDDIDIIDKNILQAVGQTVQHVIYYEK
ncbi:MAG: M28 family peptidase [Cyclobacteriaceae bacterium]|nr:M28 family peptidase [Cyclobacteriaceae bacterium]